MARQRQKPWALEEWLNEIRGHLAAWPLPHFGVGRQQPALPLAMAPAAASAHNLTFLSFEFRQLDVSPLFTPKEASRPRCARDNTPTTVMRRNTAAAGGANALA